MDSASEVLDKLGGFETDRPPDRRRLDRRARHRAHRRTRSQACRDSDAVLLAAVGGPKWDTTNPDDPRPEQGLLGLRKGLELFANLRPVRPAPSLLDASPLKRDRIEGTDLLVVRELTGGIYFGDSRPQRRHAPTTRTPTPSTRSTASRASPSGSRARKVTSVDKANVLETSRLWRETVEKVAKRLPGHAARAPAGRQRRDAARLAARRTST